MITSVDNPRIKDIAKLKQKKYRDQTGRFIVEGDHLVEEAHKADVIDTIFTTKQETAYPKALVVSPHVMKKITDAKHPPTIIAVCKQTLATDIGEKVLILEEIQDPGNLGTLIRSALAFGFKTIVLDNTVDLFNPKVLRATQGALFKLAFVFIDVKTFKTQHPNHTLYATDTTAPTPLAKPKLPFAILLGNEGQGLKKTTRDLADHILSIPTSGVDSLNVAVAGSILMQATTDEPLFKP